MAYLQGKPNGKLWAGNVKWSSDYKHIMLFNSESARNTFFKEHLKQVENDRIYFEHNGQIKIDGNINGIENYNYCVFQNDSDISDEYYFCFIDDFIYSAPNTTILSVTIDVFQTYFYTATITTSFIERATVKPSSDIAGAWLENESTGNAQPIVTRDISTIFSKADWQPQWVLHTASYYNSDTGKYEYDGVAENNTFGEYGKYIDTKADLTNMLKQYGRQSLDDTLAQVEKNIEDSKSDFWKTILNAFLSGGTSLSAYESVNAMSDGMSLAQFSDHRDELIGIYAIPKWAKGSHLWATNELVKKSQKLTLTNNLACGYNPKNKKLLTSLYKGYILYSYNGSLITYKPEAFTSAPTVICSAVPMGVSKFYTDISNYGERQKQHISVSYNCERRVGYDSNTGLNKALGVLNSVVGISATIPQLKPPTLDQIDNLVTSLDQQGTGFGTNSELLDIIDEKPVLRWADVSPSLSQCKAIDDYFDIYGYSINRHHNIVNRDNNINIYSRPYWNYIKTRDFNCKIKGPANAENKLKEIFNSGCTLWHDYSKFGDYSQDNR